MLDKMLHLLAYYFEFGIHFIFQHLMTMEGMIGILFGLFFLGLVMKIRTEY